jgi:hypothetical protein
MAMKAPTVLYYTDARHPLVYMYEPPMQPEELASVVDELTGTPVDALHYCLGDGRTFLHDTKVRQLARYKGGAVTLQRLFMVLSCREISNPHRDQSGTRRNDSTALVMSSNPLEVGERWGANVPKWPHVIFQRAARNVDQVRPARQTRHPNRLTRPAAVGRI